MAEIAAALILILILIRIPSEIENYRSATVGLVFFREITLPPLEQMGNLLTRTEGALVNDR